MGTTCGSEQPFSASPSVPGRRDRAADVTATYTVTMDVRHRTGTWKLRVRDTARGATGHIDSWTLTVA